MISKKEVLLEIEKVLEIPEDTLKENSSSDEINQWDSIGHLGILIALDKIFEGKIAGIPDVAQANSVDKILAILLEHHLVK